MFKIASVLDRIVFNINNYLLFLLMQSEKILEILD
jgi:hypothetical protein